MIIFTLIIGWAILGLFALSLCRASAKETPKPKEKTYKDWTPEEYESLESDEPWDY